jgi:hypothetical protein
VRRLILKRSTGADACDLAAARKIIRQIVGAQNQKECLLIDCEGVKISSQFLFALLVVASEEKVRFCGLPPDQQRLVALSKERKL